MMLTQPTDYLNINKVYPPWWENVNSVAAAQAQIKTYICPSAPTNFNAYWYLFTYWGSSAVGTIGGDDELKSSPGAIGGFSTVIPPGTTLGVTNYMAVSGWMGGVYPPYIGLFTNRLTVNMEQLTAADGASNTMMFGEYLGDHYPVGDGLSVAGENPIAALWISCGAMSSAWGLPADTGTGSHWYSFGSRHTAICQFVYGDGSVRGARKGVGTPASFVFASGYQDGRVVNFDTFSN
jgi:hypothetical protein